MIQWLDDKDKDELYNTHPLKQIIELYEEKYYMDKTECKIQGTTLCVTFYDSVIHHFFLKLTLN